MRSSGKALNELDPDTEAAAAIIEEGLEYNQFITFAGLCAVEYEGRASSRFGFCDCFIALKPDGTFLVHQRDGRQPVNWQPPGCSISVDTDADDLIVVGRRTSPEEQIAVRVAEVYSVSTYDVDESVEKNLFGTEDQMQTRLMENPEELEEGFRTVEAEKPISVGSIDIFGYDAGGTPVIVELKRRRAGPDAVDQLKRYVDTYSEDCDGEVRGILVAPSFTDSTEEFLQKEGLESESIEPRTDVEDTKTTLDQFGEN